MNERSPRFPFIPLSEAIEAVRKVDAAIVAGARPNRGTILQALGYSSEHGAAMKTVAALTGYGLLRGKGPEAPWGEVTELAGQLLGTPDESVKLAMLRRAALTPPIFRRIWRKARLLAADEMVDLLVLKGFTDDGARRATSIYRANSELARLAELQIEPDLPDRSEKMTRKEVRATRKRVEAAMARQAISPVTPQAGPQVQNLPPMLSLPLSTGKASVPMGITAEDFDLLIQTLTLWKPRLVR